MSAAAGDAVLRLRNIGRLRHAVTMTAFAILLKQSLAAWRAGRIDDVGSQRIDLSIAQFLPPWRHFEVSPSLADELAQLLSAARKWDSYAMACRAIGGKQ